MVVADCDVAGAAVRAVGVGVAAEDEAPRAAAFGVDVVVVVNVVRIFRLILNPSDDSA